jgi:hypothetical protein
VQRAVFHYSLPDTIYTLADIKRCQRLTEESKSIEREKLTLWYDNMMDKLRGGVRGFLVEFPLNFLKDEQMSPQFGDVEWIIPRNVFL